MKPKLRHVILLAVVALLALRELGWVRLDLAETSDRGNSTVTRATADGWPNEPLGAVVVEVLPPGEGNARVEVQPGGGVRIVVATEPVEIEGLDWLPLFKRVTYRGVGRVGLEITVQESGIHMVELLGDAPVGFRFEWSGQRTIVGFHSRRSLHAGLREEFETWVRESVIDAVREAESDARAERAAEADAAPAGDVGANRSGLGAGT